MSREDKELYEHFALVCGECLFIFAAIFFMCCAVSDSRENEDPYRFFAVRMAMALAAVVCGLIVWFIDVKLQSRKK